MRASACSRVSIRMPVSSTRRITSVPSFRLSCCRITAGISILPDFSTLTEMVAMRQYYHLKRALSTGFCNNRLRNSYAVPDERLVARAEARGRDIAWPLRSGRPSRKHQEPRPYDTHFFQTFTRRARGGVASAGATFCQRQSARRQRRGGSDCQRGDALNPPQL